MRVGLNRSALLAQNFTALRERASPGRHLEAVAQNSSEPEEEYDDLLNDEIYKADLFLDTIGRFGFLAKRGDKFAV